MQVVYAGKTPACLPKVEFPPDWHVTFTPNHWCNEETMMGYLHHILIPYVKKVRSKRSLSTTHPALVVFDHFKGQMTDKFLDTLEKNNILIVEVPANCTDRLQPLELSINKPLKSHMKNSFQQWYAMQVMRSLEEGKSDVQPVDLWLSVLKPLGFQWLMDACFYIQSRKMMIMNGFQEAGITEALTGMV